MGIYVDENKLETPEHDLKDPLGRLWGVFNRPGTGMFEVRFYKLEDGVPVFDRRVPAPPECAGVWTKREWAVAAIKRFLHRMDEETKAADKAAKNRAISEKRKELEKDNAADPS